MGVETTKIALANARRVCAQCHRPPDQSGDAGDIASLLDVLRELMNAAEGLVGECDAINGRLRRSVTAHPTASVPLAAPRRVDEAPAGRDRTLAQHGQS